MKFISVPEIRAKIRRPLIGFRQQHSAGKVFIQFLPQFFQNLVGLRQVLAICAFSFHEVWHRVETEGIHTHLQPELHDIPHLFPNRRIVIVQIGLMIKKAMPIIGF